MLLPLTGESHAITRPTALLTCFDRLHPPDKGTGAFQYFIKLVPTMHSLGQRIQSDGAPPQGGLLGKDGEQGVPQLTSLTSQFAYTYKFRSLKGATEYHTEHQDGEEKEDKGSKRENAITSMLLPGLCKGSVHCCGASVPFALLYAACTHCRIRRVVRF